MFIRDLEVKSRWYVRLPGATTLLSVIVIETTDLTVVLQQDRGGLPSSQRRYLFSDIEFIEAY
jgi:hypothetical protein